MNDNKSTYIKARVTEKQHRIIKEEAEKNNTTMSALLLRRFENNVTVYLDTSDGSVISVRFMSRKSLTISWDRLN